MGQRPPKIEDSIAKADSRPAGGTGPSGKLANQLWMGGKQRNLRYAYDAPFSKRWTQQMRDHVYQQASLAAGKEIHDIVEFQKWWKKAVDGAAQAFQASGGTLKLTPAMVLDQMAETSLANAATKRGKKVGGTQTSVTKSVDEISDGTAWGVIDEAVRSALGRAATDKELRRFISKAHQIASRNPTITRETQTADAKGNVSTASKSKGGATRDDYMLAAQNMASTPEAAAYQAASTYFGALQQALGATANLQNPV